MNDQDRQDFVDNDEGLYNMQRLASNKREWIISNRAMIDEVVGNILSGEQPAHYLEYGNQLGCRPKCCAGQTYHRRV